MNISLSNCLTPDSFQKKEIVNESPLGSYALDKEIQNDTIKFLKGEAAHLSLIVLMRLEDLRRITPEASLKYHKIMPYLSKPTQEQQKIIDTFHENLTPDLEQIAAGNTFLKKKRNLA